MTMIERINAELLQYSQRWGEARKLLEQFDTAIFKLASDSHGRLRADRHNGYQTLSMGSLCLVVKQFQDKVAIDEKTVKTFEEGENIIVDTLVMWCKCNSIKTLASRPMPLETYLYR